MYIQRHQYLGVIQNRKGKGLIQVLTWQRRVGKSTILRQISETYIKNEVIYIDKESKQRDLVFDDKTLYDFIKNEIRKDGVWKIVLIDEVQQISQRELAVLSLQNEYPSLDIIITWSNSEMLSSHLATRLRWRYIWLHIYPFSYDEYCVYHSYEKWFETFLQFLDIWWFPLVYKFDEHKEQTDMMKSIINTIFIKDMVEYFKVRDISLLEDLLMYFINNSWNITSVTNIVSYYVSKWKAMNNVTISQYISYLQSSFLLNKVESYDIQWKKILARNNKYYPSDHSRRKHMFSEFDPGKGKALEILVYISAKRNGRDIYVWRIKNKEIDFVIEKNGQKKYIQVAYLIADQKVADREFGNLLEIHDAYPKYVISMDQVSLWNFEWVQHIQAREMEKIFQN